MEKPTMTTDQALNVLRKIASQVSAVRAVHVQVDEALDTLQSALQSKSVVQHTDVVTSDQKRID